MVDWWDSLEPLLKFLYCIAIPSSLLLLIQTVQILLGFGSGGEGFNPSDTSGLDFDASSADLHTVDFGDAGDITGAGNSDLAHDSASAEFGDLRLFSLQGFVALLTVFSWTSISFVTSGTNIAVSLGVGVLLGVIAMYLVAKVIQLTIKMTASGNFNIKNALGQMGTVYIPIGEKGGNMGKITLTAQDTFMEMDAITYGDSLNVGQFVRVVDIRDGVLVVEKGDN